MHLVDIMSTRILNGWKEGDEVQAEIETNEDSVKVNPYIYAIRVKGNYFDVTKTVGHIPREISRHVYFFIKVTATDMRYFARSKFFRSLVHKKNFILTWQVVFNLGYLFYQGR